MDLSIKRVSKDDCFLLSDCWTITPQEQWLPFGVTAHEGVFYNYHSPSILAFNYRILLNKF